MFEDGAGGGERRTWEVTLKVPKVIALPGKGGMSASVVVELICWGCVYYIVS